VSDVLGAALLVGLGRGLRLVGQLLDRCGLAFDQIGQIDLLAVGQVQEVVVDLRIVLVDLVEDRRPVLGRDFVVVGVVMGNRPLELELGAGQDANGGQLVRRGGRSLIRRAEAARTAAEILGHESFTDSCGPRVDMLEREVAHSRTPSCVWFCFGGTQNKPSTTYATPTTKKCKYLRYPAKTRDKILG
jgi:hypothetical protein